jgi:N-sulfoglucosamine sulfohydrolase
MDGKSFLATIRGQDQEGRDLVYKVYNENSGGNRSPMRCVQSKKFGYHFNPWSDGKRVFKTATQGTMSYRKMKELAPNDEKIAARLDHFEHNSPEEFYDYEYDPDGLNNLVNDPKYAEEVAKHRAAMREFMKDSNDPILEAFDNRDDPAMASAYVDKVQKESDVRRANRRKGKRAKPNNAKGANAKGSANSGKARPAKPLKQNKNLFAFELPESVSKGSQMKVVLKHVLRDELAEQKFHVTLKDANGKRIDRVVKSASGTGELEVTFEVPAGLGTDGVMVSAFIGEDYPTNLLHKTEGPIKAK